MCSFKRRMCFVIILFIMTVSQVGFGVSLYLLQTTTASESTSSSTTTSYDNTINTDGVTHQVQHDELTTPPFNGKNDTAVKETAYDSRPITQTVSTYAREETVKDNQEVADAVTDTTDGKSGSFMENVIEAMGILGYTKDYVANITDGLFENTLTNVTEFDFDDLDHLSPNISTEEVLFEVLEGNQTDESSEMKTEKMTGFSVSRNTTHDLERPDNVSGAINMNYTDTEYDSLSEVEETQTENKVYDSYSFFKETTETKDATSSNSSAEYINEPLTTMVSGPEDYIETNATVNTGNDTSSNPVTTPVTNPVATPQFDIDEFDNFDDIDESDLLSNASDHSSNVATTVATPAITGSTAVIRTQSLDELPVAPSATSCSNSDGWNLHGHDWGCCGNYDGCCIYASMFCFFHDMYCQCCERGEGICGPTCKPEAVCFNQSEVVAKATPTALPVTVTSYLSIPEGNLDQSRPDRNQNDKDDIYSEFGKNIQDELNEESSGETTYHVAG